MQFNPSDVLINDIGAVGGQLAWLLYEVLEEIEPYIAADIAREYGNVISLSCLYIIHETQGAECLKAICDALDDLSQPGQYFGFPKGSENILGWFDEGSGTLAA